MSSDAIPAVPPPSPCSGFPVGVATVMLSKKDGWQTVMTHTLCWRQGISDKDTMRGIAVSVAMESKPGFSVDSVLVDILDIPNTH